MARDKELQKLVDEAAKQRREDAIDAQLTERKDREEQWQAAHDATDIARKRPRSVFMRMTGYGIGLGWWITLATCAIAVGPVGGWFRIVAGVFALAFVARVVAYIVRLRVEYPKFLRFPAGLPFAVNGGAELLESKVHKDTDDWHGNATVRVGLAAEADTVVVEAMLDLFVRLANGRYYSPGGPIGGASGDPRVDWKRTGLEVTGSANTWVLREIYRLIFRLAWLHAKQGGIASVTITLGSGIYDIPHPSVD